MEPPGNPEAARDQCHTGGLVFLGGRNSSGYESVTVAKDLYFRVDMRDVDPKPGSTSRLGAALRRLGLVELIEEAEICGRCKTAVNVTLLGLVSAQSVVGF